MITTLVVPEDLRSLRNPYPVHCTTGVEQYFYDFVQRRRDLHTTLPYLPLFWTANYFAGLEPGADVLHAVERVQGLVDSLADTPCFTVVQADEIYEHLPASILVFGAGGSGTIPIPLLTDPVVPVNRRRDILCSFAGAISLGACSNDPAGDGAGMRIRRRMLALFDTLHGFQIHLRPWQHTPEWYDSPYCLNGDEYVRSYRELLARSLFTLCPRGYGPTSFRLYEAIQAGSIPIYISDELWLPYRDELDWREFALIVHEDDLADIPRRIRDLSAMAIARMQARLAEVAASHFNLESTCERIVAMANPLRLEAAATLPVLTASVGPAVAGDMRSLV